MDTCITKENGIGFRKDSNPALARTVEEVFDTCPTESVRAADGDVIGEGPELCGKWIAANNRPRSWQFKCSRCGSVVYYPTPKFAKKECSYKRCPECLAYMLNGEETKRNDDRRSDNSP